MASRRRRNRRPKLDARRPRLVGGVSPDRYLWDAQLRHAVELQRLSTTEARRLSRIWTDLEDPLSKAIVGRLERLQARGLIGPYRSKTYRDTINRIKDLAEEARATFLSELTAVVKTVAGAESVFQGRTMATVLDALNPEVIFRLPPVNILRGAALSPTEGRTLVQWSQSLKTSTANNIGGIVNRGLMRGDPLPVSTKQVRTALQTTRRQAEAVTRTAIRHSSAAAREVVYKDNSDIVVGVVWVSVLDNRTTDICGPLDGKTFPVGEGIRPPAHFNCRSDVSPLLRSPADIVSGDINKPVTQADRDRALARRRGTRAAFDLGGDRNRPVPARQTYGQWLRNQPAVWQDRMLGRTRAKWFREGRLQMDDFVGADHLPLTIGELRKRYGL